MNWPEILYCGEDETSASRFKCYLDERGLKVHLVRSAGELPEAGGPDRPVVRVIASDRDGRALAVLVCWIRRSTANRYPILIFGRDSYALLVPQVEVVPPAGYLETGLRRLWSMMRDREIN